MECVAATVLPLFKHQPGLPVGIMCARVYICVEVCDHSRKAICVD